MFDAIRLPPFNLKDDAMAWVKETFAAMSVEHKVGQLFNIILRDNTDANVELVRSMQPGAVTKFASGSLDEEIAMMNKSRSAADLPLLVSSDLEGGNMSFPFGAQVPNQLGLAGLDKEAVRYATDVIAQEAKLLGINWSFTPVVDINRAFRSAIVGTRSYGSDPETIKTLAQVNIETFQSHGIAATAKHWPGEGIDDRDQHLVTTINSMTMDEWHQSFGSLYREMIDQGVLSIMSAHIALPEYVKQFESNPEEFWRPASVNKHINQTLLREELGFNGLIVSDASVMGGVSSWDSRENIVIETIENGCDMILFCRDPMDDYAYLIKALSDGRLSEKRLNESVIRILAMKAALGLHQPQAQLDAKAFRSLLNTDYADKIDDLASKTPHLAKDRQHIIPLSTADSPRVLVISSGIRVTLSSTPKPLLVAQMLRDAGFEVTEFEVGQKILAQDFDWILYLIADESMMAKSHIFIDWKTLHGSFGEGMYRPWVDVPTVMVSFGHPYLLYDAPRVSAYINAYSPLKTVQQAVVDGLVGKIPFNKNSPIDPFCGLEQLRY